MTNNQIKQP